ncbi:hypothetical protein RAF22_26105, partial [Klebsiella pneumoniae]
KIGPDPRNFNQRVSLGRNDLLIRTFHSTKKKVSTARFFQFLIDHYGENAKNEFIEAIIKSDDS